MMNKEKMIICVLAVLLVIAVVYIGVTKYQAAKQEKENGLIQQGVRIGYEQAVIQLMNEASSCKEVPVFYNNGTANFNMTIIAVECLKQASAGK